MNGISRASPSGVFARHPILRIAAAAAMAGAAGCAAVPVHPPAAAAPAAAGPNTSSRVAAIPPAGAAADPSLDWQQLITVPFASTLKDLPFAVRDVLQFDAAGRPAAEGRAAEGRGGAEECFRREAAPPHFLGRDLEDYVLCFRRDRLDRIEADLRLDTDGVEAVFGRYCDGWLKNTTLVARSEANCRGQAGAIVFDARLDEDRSQTTSSMSMVLTQDVGDAP